MTVFSVALKLMLVYLVIENVSSVTVSKVSAEVDVPRLWQSFGDKRSKRAFSGNYYYKNYPGPVVFDTSGYESDTPPPDYMPDDDKGEIYFYPTPVVPLPPPISHPVPKDTPPIGPNDSYGVPQSSVTEPTEMDIKYGPYPPLPPIPETPTTTTTERMPVKFRSYLPPILKVPEMMPTKELINIAEQHIKEEEKSENILKLQFKPPSTSYGVPYAHIHPPEKEENKTMVKMMEAPKMVNLPPALSYGVPDQKIETMFTKEITESKSSSSQSVEAEQEAKPYPLLSSSYGAPLKSVTDNAPLKPLMEHHSTPLPKDAMKPDSKEEKKTEMCGKYVLIPMEEYMNMNFCLQKSIDFTYTLNKDGTLMKT